MVQEVFYLSYVSTVKDGLQFKDFKNILEIANEKNALKNITGILVYCNNHFFQILEGNKEDVLEVYDSIMVDCRHDNLIKLQEGTTANRQFENWEMAFKSYNTELQRLDNFNNEEFYSYIKKKLGDSNHISLKILANFFDLNGNAEIIKENTY